MRAGAGRVVVEQYTAGGGERRGRRVARLCGPRDGECAVPPPRVLFNGVTLLKPRTGIAHAAANLRPRRVTAGYSDRRVLASTPARWPSARRGRRFFRPGNSSAGPHRSQEAERDQATRDQARLGGRPRSLATRTHFQTVARLGRFDLYHEPNFVPFRTGLPLVVTIFDLSVLLFPQWHPAERVKAHEHAYTRGIALADHVIVGTEAVRAEAQRHLGLAPDRVTAMLCGVGPQFRPQSPEAVAAIRAKHNLPPRYTLYVGTIEPRKNIGTLLRAFCDLPRELCEACPLVLAGGWGWKAEAERELFHSEARHKGALHIGYVPDSDLPALYAGAGRGSCTRASTRASGCRRWRRWRAARPRSPPRPMRCARWSAGTRRRSTRTTLAAGGAHWLSRRARPGSGRLPLARLTHSNT